MKKISLIILLGLMPIFVLGQRIRADITDDSTGERIIETMPQNIYEDGFSLANKKLSFFLKHNQNGDAIQFSFIPKDKDFIMIKGDKAIFKMKSGKEVELTSLADTEFIIRAPGSQNSDDKGGEYTILEYGGDFSIFETDDFVESIRFKNSTKEFNIKIKPNSADKVNKAYQLIQERLKEIF